MTTPKPTRIVAELTGRQKKLEPSALIVAQNALSDQLDWIADFGERTTQPGATAVVYMPGQPGDSPVA
jgi:hypothetical protein